MRHRSILVTSLAALAMLTACSRHSTVTNSATAPAGFVPPTALNRNDFGGLVAKRFQRLDVDHDSVISAAEIPLHNHDVIASFDTNGDGRITRDEFTKGSFARFDSADLNKDGTLTGEERRTARLGTDVKDTETPTPDTGTQMPSPAIGNGAAPTGS